MKGSLIIVAFFVAGLIAGHFLGMPELLGGDPALWVLYGLMFLVGVSVGSDRKPLGALRHQRPAVVLVPLGTILGTLAGVAAVSVLLPAPTARQSVSVRPGSNTLNIKELSWAR